MPTITFEEAVAKARAYGNGVIPIPKSPDTTVVHKSQAATVTIATKSDLLFQKSPAAGFSSVGRIN